MHHYMILLAAQRTKQTEIVEIEDTLAAAMPAYRNAAISSAAHGRAIEEFGCTNNWPFQVEIGHFVGTVSMSLTRCSRTTSASERVRSPFAQPTD